MKPAHPARPAVPLRSGSPAKSLFINRTLRRALCRTLVVALPFVMAALPLLRDPAASAAINACDLDLTFGNAGKVTTTFPGGLDSAHDMAVQTDGKIVVAGLSGTDFALARYNTDGSLDTTFGTGGRVNTDFPFGQGGLANALVIQPNGKIVLAGSATDPATEFNSAFALVRYHTDGSLDTSFDADGRVVTPFPDGSASANDIALQPDGKLVAAGVRANSSTFASVFALARYNADGSLDNSFDTDGRVTTDLPGFTFEEANAVAVQTDGRVVVAGQGNGAFALARYNVNGGLDSSFDMDGLVTTDFGGSFESANALAIQADGKIIAAGEVATSVAADDNFALARYNTDGSPDNSFDVDGKVTTDFDLVDSANAVLIQADGRIVAAGRAGTIPAGTFFALARYHPNGSLDSTFDADGKVLTDVSGGRFNLGAFGVAIQADGRIVAAGGDNTGGQLDFGVIRYNANGSPDTSFDADGKATTDFPLNEETVTDLELQADGKIVAVGRMNARVLIKDAQDPNFQLARYNANGSLDPTFGTGGLASTDFAGNGDDLAHDAALQPDGKIVVVGQTGARFSQVPSADTAFAIARYNANGSLDPTFGTGGKVTIDFDARHDFALAVALQADGRIVVAGTNFLDFLLARLNADGSLDSGAAGDATPGDSFGTGGRVVTDFNERNDAASGVVIQTDGKIVAAGSSADDFALARYHTDGNLDAANFGTGGKVTTDFAAGSDGINNLVIQTDGKILAAGSATLPSTGSDFALARYHPNGSLDTVGFGTGGKVTTDFGGFDTAADLALHTDGRIVLAGLYFPTDSAAQAAVAPAKDRLKAADGVASGFFALARYNPNGSPDATACADGHSTTDFFGVYNEATAVVIQPDGRVIAGGVADTGSSNDFALARYGTPPAPPPTPLPRAVQFAQTAQAIGEGAGSVTITVVRSGDTSAASNVDYATAPDAAFVGCDVLTGTASERCDFTTTLGTLRFAAGETSKTFQIFITDDAYVETGGAAQETFTVTLSNATGSFLTGPPATITITDNDPATPGANPIDNSTFFVKMHYVDFLNREGEQAGVEGWVNSLNTCPPGGLSCDRVEVSSRFFRSTEFMLKGNFVIRFYRVSLGRNPGYRDFTRDSQRVTGQTAAEVFANRDAFTNEWVERADFRAAYDGLSNQAYVDKLEQTAGVTLSNKAQLVAALDQMTKTRAQVLRDVVESNEVRTRMFNDAFVLMEYFGYLRRDAEPTGFNAWLAYLNAHPGDYRTMVRGFVNSVEYRKRFGDPGQPQPGQF